MQKSTSGFHTRVIGYANLVIGPGAVANRKCVGSAINHDTLKLHLGAAGNRAKTGCRVWCLIAIDLCTCRRSRE